MFHQTGNKAVRRLTQPQRIRFIIKGVFPILEQAHIDMHTRTVDAMDGLWHKGGV